MARQVLETKISKFVQNLYKYVLSYTILNYKFYETKLNTNSYILLQKEIQFNMKINSLTFFKYTF